MTLESEIQSASEELLRVRRARGPGAALAELRIRRDALQATLAGWGGKTLPSTALEGARPRGIPRKGGCAQINPGMSRDQVKAILGPPDEIRSAEDLRGPGAVRWVYRDVLCQIHLLDGVVEFVD